MRKAKHGSGFMLGNETEDKKYFIHNKKRFELILDELGKRYMDNNKISVLDVGTSPLTFLIKRKYPKIRLTTMDYSDNFKNECKKQKILFIKQDLNKKENKLKKNSYDVVLFLEVIEHLKGDNMYILNSFIKSLKKEGSLFVQTPNKYSLKTLVLKVLSNKLWNELSNAPMVGEEFEHFKEYDFDELKNILQSLKESKLVVAKRPLYYDEPESTMVYRKNRAFFYIPMYAYFLIVALFPFFRRGMYFKLDRIYN